MHETDIVDECRCLDYIEELIHKQESLVNVLRLLILFSITNSGLPKKNFDYLRQELHFHIIFQFNPLGFISYIKLFLYWFRRELLHSYGFEHMVTLRNLEKAGLLKKQVRSYLLVYLHKLVPGEYKKEHTIYCRSSEPCRRQKATG